MLKSTSDMQDDHQFLVSAEPPSREQTQLAAWVLLVLLIALLITVPFARVSLTNTEILLPAYATAVLMNELITSALLFVLFSIRRSLALLVLAIGYLFTALMIGPWVLTFPGVFAPSGLLDAGLQGTALIAGVRRVGFPLFVLAYALLKDADPIVGDVRGSVRAVILGSVVAVVAIVCGLTWFSVVNDAVLPRLMADNSQVSTVWQYVPASTSILCFTGLVVLWVRRRSVLDLWLMVVLCAWLIETFLLGYFSAGRFSVGWWAGRVYGFTSASVVLLVLLAETTTLYARLARSVSAERRIREARLMTMEVLSASIAHEVNQPLASMVTHADAGIRWLDRKTPDLDEVLAALKSIVSDGHRAGKMIESVRMVFRKGVQDRTPLNINELIQEVLKHTQDEVQLNRVYVQTELSGQMPLIIGNSVQLQQVVLNLVTNAVDAMSSVTDRARVLRIKSELHKSGCIMISVEDAGIGLDEQHKDRIFEPFFTTKSHGLGMGLMICQSIVEAHGGHLWMMDNVPQGTTFQFTLPVDAGNVPSIAERVL
jgi:signal transduction histidine kinase